MLIFFFFLVFTLPVHAVAGPTAVKITIIDFSGLTGDSTPSLSILAINADEMHFSCNGIIFDVFVPYNTSYDNFNLKTGAGCTLSDGLKTVFAEFRDNNGTLSGQVSDSTQLDSTPPTFNFVDFYPDIVFDVNNVTLQANITDLRLNKVWITANFENGSVKTYLLSLLGLDNYTFKINADFLFIGDTVTFQYHANDTLGNENASSPFVFQVVGSSASVFPPIPNCNESWYTFPPVIVLTPAVGSNLTQYNWGFESSVTNYTSPFNQTGIPGGIETLFFWSIFNPGPFQITEPRKQIIVPIDLTLPTVKNETPANNTITYSTLPHISAELHDVYFNNSEINLSSVKMVVDGFDITPFTTQVMYNSTVYVNYSPSSPLFSGVHTVQVYMEDHACHNSNYDWFFTVNDTYAYQLFLLSPNLTVYNTKQIDLTIKTTEQVQTISWSLNGQRTSRLCQKCDQYSRRKGFREGDNSIVIEAWGIDWIRQNISFDFFVDATPPRIVRTDPKKDLFLKGMVNFTATIRENLNITSLMLYTNISGVTNNSVPCTFDSTKSIQQCSLELDLSNYEGEFWYFFRVFDTINNDTSPIIIDTVDNIPPIVTIIEPNLTLYGIKRITDKVLVSEQVRLFSQINDQKSRTACTNCAVYDRDNSFPEGKINLTFIGEDNAGNRGEASVNFEVDTKPPRISRTEPRKDTFRNATINFTLRYTESSVHDILLVYTHNGSQTIINFTENQSCPSGSNVECTKEIPVAPIDGILEYYFILTDALHNDTSSPVRIFVDVTPPEVAILSPEDHTYFVRSVRSTVDISEDVEKIEQSLDQDVFKRSCTKCDSYDKLLSYKNGNHTLIFRAYDFVGNIGESSIHFTVDYGTD